MAQSNVPAGAKIAKAEAFAILDQATAWHRGGMLWWIAYNDRGLMEKPPKHASVLSR
jgi:hypothetical protein